MFIGTYQHNLDNKGRVIMPARFREELGESFYITMGINKCLFVLSKESWDGFLEKLSGQPISKATDISRFFCAGAVEAVPNAQGRVLIPENLRKYADIGKDVTVVGVGSRVEIWSTDRWNDYLEKQSQDSIMSAMELLGI